MRGKFYQVKKQLILTACGLLVVVLLFQFGKTSIPKSAKNISAAKSQAAAFSIARFIETEKKKLSPSQSLALSKLENSVIRGDVSAQQVKANMQLADFWRDSVHLFEPYIYYLSEAAKLDKSEKNLTFAAQLILNNLRAETDEAKLNWKAEQAIALFEQAIELNPSNDDLQVGLGSSYVFGKGRAGQSDQTMKGIQILLSVVRKDSNNMKAQMMLGIGGSISGQYDKAVERLLKVVKAQPDNLEAIAFLADTYAAKGDKAEAIKWYTISKRLANDQHYTQEVDERIRQLK